VTFTGAVLTAIAVLLLFHELASHMRWLSVMRRLRALGDRAPHAQPVASPGAILASRYADLQHSRFGVDMARRGRRLDDIIDS
jgi:hypothetical protein